MRSGRRLFQPPGFHVSICNEIADSADFSNGNAEKMGDMGDSGAFHVLNSAIRARSDLLRDSIGAGARGDRYKPRSLGRWEHLKWQLIEERARSRNNREAKRLHIEETGRTLRAKVAINLHFRRQHISDPQAGGRVHPSNSADDDGIRTILNDGDSRCMCCVNWADASDNDVDPLIASKPRANNRRFEVSCSANQKAHSSSSDFAI